MFAAIRSYQAKDPVSEELREQLARDIERDFVPKIEHLRGFHGYYAVDAGPNRLVTISLFETMEGCNESTRIAAEHLKTTKMPVDLGSPDVAEGEIRVLKEAAVGAH
jgi:hypothetical protein